LTAESKFYIVLSDPWQRKPNDNQKKKSWKSEVTRIFSDKKDAMVNARAATKKTGERYFVLETVGVASQVEPPVEWQEL
jgi:folate-dependent phosphoribosylglycinamide formyltransferase PurN